MTSHLQRLRRLHLIVLICLLLTLWLSLYFGGYYGHGFSGVSISHGELQIAWETGPRSIHITAEPPQGWAFYRTPVDIKWSFAYFNAFGVQYLLLPLWIPIVIVTLAALLLELFYQRKKHRRRTNH